MVQRNSSWRRQPLPPGWASVIRPAVLQRDGYRCQWPIGARICGQHATDVDHRDPDGPQADAANCWSLCQRHHRYKTGRDAGAAWGKIRKAMAAAKTRDPERHPGLL